LVGVSMQHGMSGKPSVLPFGSLLFSSFTPSFSLLPLLAYIVPASLRLVGGDVIAMVISPFVFVKL